LPASIATAELSAFLDHHPHGGYLAGNAAAAPSVDVTVTFAAQLARKDRGWQQMRASFRVKDIAP
jgi:hypothetical protein